MSNKLLKFVNCKVLRNHKIINQDLWIRGGRIVEPENESLMKTVEIIALNDLIIAPGFIEVQMYGGFGIDLTHDYVYNNHAVETIARKLPEHGVTAFCPTFVSTTPQIYREVLTKFKAKPGGSHGATIIGAHLEGPFLNPQMRGNHHSPRIINNIAEGMKTVNDVYSNLSAVKMVTLAPEIRGCYEVIDALTKKDIITCIGNSLATMEEAEKAHLNGVRMICHLFNAMGPFHHRSPGILGLLLSKYFDNIFYSIVCDGYHLHPTVINIAYRLNPKRAILSTLANSALGSPKNRLIHHIGEKAFEVQDQGARLARKGTISGGIRPMIKCVKDFYEITNCSMAEALEAASHIPAKFLNIEKNKGTLNVGSDADFVIINEHFEIQSTWIAGESVYVAIK